MSVRRRDILKAPAALPLAAAAMSAKEDQTRDWGIVKNQSSPRAKLRNVDLDSVQWTQGFWADRFEQTHKVTLRRLWELLADPDSGHVLDNFRLASGAQAGQFAGANWQDAWLYKWIEAGASIYRLTGDAWIDERMDEAIELIVDAQQDDGYVSTQITVPGKKRWQDPREHEAYVMGHLLTAACVHHRVTGKRSMLDLAIATGDFLTRTLGVTVDPGFAHNPTPIMGLVELYRETGNKDYLAGAGRILDGRGHNPKKGGLFYRRPGVLGSDLIQDRVPFREQTEVVGHNVFFTYLFAGAADLYMENGDQTILDALHRYWDDLTERKICINGGVSPMGHGLSIGGDPVVEAVGKAYNLPAADCYNETCGQVGNLLWNYRMLLISPEARYADMMELEMYNGFLGGIGLEGKSWFYRNVLRRYDVDHKSQGHNDEAARGEPGRKRICCPTNLLRTFAQLQNYVYSVSDEGLWIHHFGGNRFRGQLPGGHEIAIAQRTGYPWHGRVEFTVDQASGSSFGIQLRIPGWAEGARVSVNGEPAAPAPVAGEYLSLRRIWEKGDVIELRLPMEPRLMQAHPKAEQLRNQVAVMRGPVLYCLESPDLPEGVGANDIYFPGDISLRSAPADDLPFGIVALEGQAWRRDTGPWAGQLYRRLQDRPMKPVSVRMIPYFAWNNRGASTMTVWIPVVLST